MGGQCLDELTSYIHDETFNEIFNLWTKYHLNDMHPECKHQAELGWTQKASEEVKIYHYCMTVEAIRKQNKIKAEVERRLLNGETVKLSDEELKFYSMKYSKTSCQESSNSNYKLDRIKKRTLGWLKENEHPEGILSKSCPICGYQYGSSWNYFPIPQKDEQRILSLLNTGCILNKN